MVEYAGTSCGSDGFFSGRLSAMQTPAPEVEYHVIVDGQMHFRCERLRAVIGIHECVQRWRGASHRQSERLILCRRCPIGAAHARPDPACAGERPAATQSAVRAELCLRCGRPASRLIRGELCPSCSNREAEWRRGANGRGSKPTKYIVPRRWRVGVIDPDGRVGWRMFVGQNVGEALARAVRSGYRLHDSLPGTIAWNGPAARFEYHDSLGRPLGQIEVDGGIAFVPLEDGGAVPARVIMPPMLATPDEAAELLPTWFDVEGLDCDWRQVDIGCRSCRSGVLHVRRRAGAIECRCSAACC